jgi:tetratricopeptide (TPR) repeat protein
MVAWSWEAGRDAEPLRAACERLLEAELWYHQMLAALGGREQVSYDDLRSLAEKRRINLTALAERIEAVEAPSPRASVVRHLLMAECHYHLRETAAVVADLQAAIADGGGHPLVHFALGYNWFDRAREMLVEPVPTDAEHAERDFRAACLQAVEAFREGLTGQPFDAQLHLWIGRVLAAAGLLEEAEAAIETAVQIDPDLLAAAAAIEGEQPPEDDAPPPGPISEEEVRRFGDRLKRPWRREELLGGG